jgi:DNA-binding response OmpR family regulator
MNARHSAGGDSELHVLVVEDDPALGRLVQLVLSRYAASVQVERTGGAAIEAAKHNLFHAVACDISLPDMSGLDIIAALRESIPRDRRGRDHRVRGRRCGGPFDEGGRG